MRARTVSPARFRRLAWWALAAQIGIVVTGAAVRLTGSGLGCTDWPGCSEDRLVPEWGFHHWVEFGNRLLTFAVVGSALVALVGAWYRRPRRAGLVALAGVLVGGVVAQALIGAALVILELDPRLTVLHFVTSMVLITAAVTLVHRSAGDGGLDRPSLVGTTATTRVPDVARRLATATGVAAMVVVGTGTVVTGSGPHGGDERADRFGFALTSVTRLHAGAMWVFLGLLLATWAVVGRGGARGVRLRPNVVTLVALTAGQAVLGYVQYALGVPAGLVALHVFGSTLVWSAAVALVLSARAGDGAGDAAAPDDDDPARRLDASRDRHRDPSQPVLS
jgi:cytochrome c oxidase assembly protein subunit 15